jgi:fructose-bisphosphate aldolase class I
MIDPYQLESVARALVAPGRGILAADESSGTIKKRFQSINLESTEPNRRAYRELLLTTPGVEAFISGVILFDETIRQSAQEGQPFTQLMIERGIIPGIKVDKSTVDLPLHPGEKITLGLDGLRERLKEYYELGARFTKWRAVYKIGLLSPSPYAIAANAATLAMFAAYSQEAGLVPIVEPEVLMDGDHTIERAELVTRSVLERVFAEIHQAGVILEGMLLKPNMVVPGQDSPVQASVTQVAEATVRTLKRVVPAAVPGIVFLSGGQTPEQATAHLNAMNALASQSGGLPWQLSFSYGRALQEPPLKTWGGDPAQVSAAQQAFHHRAMLNSAARTGQYTPEMEKVTV